MIYISNDNEEEMFFDEETRPLETKVEYDFSKSKEVDSKEGESFMAGFKPSKDEQKKNIEEANHEVVDIKKLKNGKRTGNKRGKSKLF